ncbi:MAG: serine/threonine protein kinase, partial [Deltaproteobacteria bacterium]|nr:serine/threonine protein kinase [Deltaproteobacteria bacterium]
MSQDPSRTTADVRVPAQATTQTRRLTSDPSDASLESDTPPDDAAIQRQRETGTRQRSFASPATAMRIGRFMVLEPLGRGGMGMVYAAYDDKLDRKVAIKVLLADDLPDDSDRLRLQREAQALARLSHPNVVTVHEVGDSDGQVFLAMEYVHGLSLRHWLRTKPDSSQVLDVFVLAGRGLAAAHHAGLVHRDLKPANIMRGDDGTVKVLDFGLALAVAEEQDESIDPAKLSGSHSPLHSSVTQTGTLLGTPAYMAPEQFTGNTADVYSDQYSFCIALWEGLTGRRPFAEATHDQRLTARLAGPPSWPPDAPALRRPIVEAMRRGLSPEPDDRWPSMDALLSALSRAPHRRRHGWALAGLGTAALAIGWLGLRDTPSVDREQRCTGAHEQLAGIWDDGRRAAVESAIVGTELSYAKGVWERTSATLDAYAHAWETMHTEACEAT